jgi:hypothetical protein
MNNTTWIDKLGRNTDWVHVDGNRIVNGFDDPCHESGGMTVLWTCDTPEEAQRILDEWLNEVIREQDAKIQNHAPPGTWASVAQMMAQSSPVEGDPDFWDRWKDEMKERDLFEDR